MLIRHQDKDGAMTASLTVIEVDITALALDAIVNAASKAVRTLAFPTISTGGFGFPVDRAAPIAVGTVAAAMVEYAHLGEVVFA